MNIFYSHEIVVISDNTDKCDSNQNGFAMLCNSLIPPIYFELCFFANISINLLNSSFFSFQNFIIRNKKFNFFEKFDMLNIKKIIVIWVLLK